MHCTHHPEVTTGLSHCSGCGQVYCADCTVPLNGGLWCIGCKENQVLALVEGWNPSQFALAGLGRRFVALFVDGVIVSGSLFILLLLFLGFFALALAEESDPMNSELMTFFFGVGQIFVSFLVTGIYIAYEGIFLARSGQTPGKALLRVKVVGPSGEDLTTGQAWLRGFMRQLLSFLSCIGLAIDYGPAFFTQEKTCVHDLAARTRVVEVPR